MLLDLVVLQTVNLQVLEALTKLPGWEQECGESANSIADALGQDPASVKLIAQLASAMQKAQEEVNKYMKTFEPYSFLWTKDLAAEYAAFLATKPELEVGSISTCHCLNKSDSTLIV